MGSCASVSRSLDFIDCWLFTSSGKTHYFFSTYHYIWHSCLLSHPLLVSSQVRSQSSIGSLQHNPMFFRPLDVLTMYVLCVSLHGGTPCGWKWQISDRLGDTTHYRQQGQLDAWLHMTNLSWMEVIDIGPYHDALSMGHIQWVFIIMHQWHCWYSSCYILHATVFHFIQFRLWCALVTGAKKISLMMTLL